MTETIEGVILDISSNNGDPSTWKWHEAKAAGVIAVFAKATQGTTYRNKFYPVNGGNIRSAGLGFRAYHYAGFTDAVKEAQWFHSVAGADATILDVETSKNEAWMNQFLAALGEPAGQEMTYGSASTLPRAGLRSLLWPASYGKDYGFGDCWQYTDHLAIPGLPGEFDASEWVGSPADFDTFFGIVPPLPPAPAPIETEIPTMYITVGPDANGNAAEWLCGPGVRQHILTPTDLQAYASLGVKSITLTSAQFEALEIVG